jgi:hypothetical protein
MQRTAEFLIRSPPYPRILISPTTLFKKIIGVASGQMLLRFLGYDAFVATKDVAACLRDAGLDIAPAPTSKRDLAKDIDVKQTLRIALCRNWANRPATPPR